MPRTTTCTRSGWGHGHVALERLVPRHDRRLRYVARSYGLSAWDTDDVVQSTWLQYLEHGHALREPAALGAWLETTARRLSLRLLQRRVREQPAEACEVGTAGRAAEPEPELLATECRTTVRRAVAELPERQRRLIGMLVARPDLGYEEIGRRLAMPIGSIGPTRARGLDRLRRDTRLRALQAVA